MRILDEQNNEITTKQVNGELGYLEVEKLLIRHHDPIEEQKQKSHFKVKSFSFTDGSSLEIYDENDSRVKVIDAEKGLFEYNPIEDNREVCGIDVEHVVDVPHRDAIAAWDEFEYIQRYKLFTPDELEENKKQEKQQQLMDKFLQTGQSQIDNIIERLERIESILNIDDKDGKE